LRKLLDSMEVFLMNFFPSFTVCLKGLSAMICGISPP